MCLTLYFCACYLSFISCPPAALGVTGTAILYGNAVRLASFARVLRLPADVAHWTALAANISAAFHAAFFNASARTYGSQTANAMALALGIAPTARARDAALSALTADIMARGVHQTGGDIGHRFILLALREANLTGILYAMHTTVSYPSYGFMLGAGATSLPEQWDGGGSQIHSMLGHVEEWLYEVHLGIQCGNAPIKWAVGEHESSLEAHGDTNPCRIRPAPHAHRLPPSSALSSGGADDQSALIARAHGWHASPLCGNISVRWALDRRSGALELEVGLHRRPRDTQVEVDAWNQCAALAVHIPFDAAHATTRNRHEASDLIPVALQTLRVGDRIVSEATSTAAGGSAIFTVDREFGVAVYSLKFPAGSEHKSVTARFSSTCTRCLVGEQGD
jgi:hypothetical protein